MRIRLVLFACVWMILFNLPPALPAHAQSGPDPEITPSSDEQPTPMITRIQDIRSFLEICPNEDPIYPKLKQDFQVRLEGELIIPDLNCIGLVSSLPVEQLTNQLDAMQIFRTIYYMSIGTEGHLSWTEKSLYDWMASSIGGINFKTVSGQQYCCDYYDGKLFISSSLNTYPQYEQFFDWNGIQMGVSFYAHETRHANPGAPGHVNGCPDFPNPSDPSGCDEAYDLSNLGAYGIQYWLHAQWSAGLLNVGIGCLPAALAQAIVEQHARNANSNRGRFMSNPPPLVTAARPYGGFCIANYLSLPFVLK